VVKSVTVLGKCYAISDGDRQDNPICIFSANKKEFEMLESKGFKPKLNIMDNQATTHIKLSLPKMIASFSWLSRTTITSNHHINVAECAIQTFKDAFIAALATKTAIPPSNCGTSYTTNPR
jgi:hypothetical protein